MPESLAGRKCLVTGGLGFIGSNLAMALVQADADVTLADLPAGETTGDHRNIEGIESSIRLVECDLREPENWRELLDGQQVVFHLAAQVSHAASMELPIDDLRANCRATLGLLDAAKRERRPPKIVFTSTRQVYGRCDAGPVTEDHPLHPPDINGIHKAAVEDYLRLYRETAGIRSTVLRLANTYGPRMDLRNPGRGVLNVFVDRALRGLPLMLFGDGAQRRDIVHVDDVIDALLRAADLEEPGPFNLGAVEPISLLTFVETLQQSIPLTWQLRPFPEDRRGIDVGDLVCNSSRFERAAGWRPRVSLEQGLASTIDWFQKQAEPVGA